MAFPVKHMQELVLNIQQFNITVPRIRKERLLVKDAVIDTRNASNIGNGRGKEN